MTKKRLFILMILLMTMSFVGCSSKEAEEAPGIPVVEVQKIEESTSESTQKQDETQVSPEADEKPEEATSDYYLNEQGILVDKVEEFKTKTFGEYELQYPILDDGSDEVVVYEFDTYDNIHVVLDASNVYQQTSLSEPGDYGDVQLKGFAPGEDIVYMYDGESYYIEDYTINLLTISEPMSGN